MVSAGIFNMRIEYLAGGAAECPLLRICDFQQSELTQLQSNCLAFAEGRRNKELVADHPGNPDANNCAVLGKIGESDQGVKQATKLEHVFVLILTNEGWQEVAEKLQPLIDHEDGYQWLSEQGDLRLLVSKNGTW